MAKGFRKIERKRHTFYLDIAVIEGNRVFADKDSRSLSSYIERLMRDNMEAELASLARKRSRT